MISRGGIILCGGNSTRMGTPKAWLPFGEEPMLARVARLMSEVCEPIVMVRSTAEQPLPELRCEAIYTADRRPGRGPLEGLAAGLAALPAKVEAAFVTTCDAPLIKPAFIARLFELLHDHSAAVPVTEGFVHPLSAVYRTSIRDLVEELLASDRQRPSLLVDCAPSRRVEPAELADVDPQLDSLRNLNHPAEYLAALVEAGLSAPAGFADRFIVRNRS
jgi:molybdopterin-guanine dinucleotide biosynthesis protein A